MDGAAPLSYPIADMRPYLPICHWSRAAPQALTFQPFELFSDLQGPWMEAGFVCRGCHKEMSQTRDLNNIYFKQNLFFSHFWRRASKIKLLADLVSSESSLLGFQHKKSH